MFHSRPKSCTNIKQSWTFVLNHHVFLYLAYFFFFTFLNCILITVAMPIKHIVLLDRVKREREQNNCQRKRQVLSSVARRVAVCILVTSSCKLCKKEYRKQEGESERGKGGWVIMAWGVCVCVCVTPRIGGAVSGSWGSKVVASYWTGGELSGAQGEVLYAGPGSVSWNMIGVGSHVYSTDLWPRLSSRISKQWTILPDVFVLFIMEQLLLLYASVPEQIRGVGQWMGQFTAE